MDKQKELQVFPPVVAVLGHVDHGKTTLLDEIRKTSIADRESGGITQKIGASSVTIDHEGKKRSITFIDTPGHEAFAEMRGRGAQAADIGLLIVAATDGVKPQTKESISLLKASGVPYIVVITKMDMDNKNPEKAKKDLAKEEVLLEGYGGDIPFIEISAKTGKNIKELLDLILLVSDLHPREDKVSNSSPFEAIVIESKQDPKAGAKASIVVKNGKICLRDEITTGKVSGKVKSLISDDGKRVNEANIGKAVEVLGFEKAPSVGDIVRSGSENLQDTQIETSVINSEDSLINIILVADTLGSLEAITHSLSKKAKILSKKTGEITTADVLMAKSTRALVLGFNIKIKPDVAHLASTEKVLVKNYTVIYEMLDEIEEVIEGKRASLLEQIYGVAKVQAEFPFDKQKVMGIKVLEGRVAKGDKVRIERGDEVIGEGYINSVRLGKDQTSKVESPNEAGIIVGPAIDFTIGDMVICHS